MNKNRQITRRAATDKNTDGWPQELHPVVRRVISARGFSPDMLDHSLQKMLPVSDLEFTEQAAERLAKARQLQQSVLILGDFDADGATATALMMSCLSAYGFEQCEFLVPDRQRFGYGLSPAIVELAAESAPDIIVTVDNGISSHAGVETAHQHGIDVLVTDHHLPGETLPAAEVIVNPNHPDSKFPSKVLAGVGVAFYVMAALGQ
ncbi:MAG: DHH family phosphoesterase, partial [Gammaproteobacteria bacterium]